MSEQHHSVPGLDSQLLELLRSNPHVQYGMIADGSNQATYQGVGDTFVGSFGEAPMLFRMPDSPVSGIDGLDTAIEVETPLSSVICIHGRFVGGIDQVGTFRLAKSYNLLENTPERIRDIFMHAIHAKSDLADFGIQPIFEPAASFEVTKGTVGTSSRIGGLILSGILERDPERFNDLQTAQQDAEAAEQIARPKYKVKVGHHELMVSDVYIAGERPSAVVYPPWYVSEEAVNPVTFYLSSTHVTWRALLALGASTRVRAKNLFGSEFSTDAPLALQKALSFIMIHAGQTRDGGGMEYFAKEVANPQGDDWDTRLLAEMMMRAALRETTGMNITKSVNVTTKFYPFFEPGFAIDFGNVLDTWSLNSRMYGTVSVRVLPSANGAVHYALHTTNTTNGFRAWIGTAEVQKAKLTKLGLMSRWVNLSSAVSDPPVNYIAERYGGSMEGYDTERVHTTPFEAYVASHLGTDA